MDIRVMFAVPVTTGFESRVDDALLWAVQDPETGCPAASMEAVMDRAEDGFVKGMTIKCDEDVTEEMVERALYGEYGLAYEMCEALGDVYPAVAGREFTVERA